MNNEKNLGEMVKAYLNNPHHKERKIALEEVGIYEIISGSNGDFGTTHSLGTYHGRYIDIIATAVKMSDFVGEWCGPDFSNINNGYIIKSKLYEIKPVEGIMEYVKETEKIEKQKKELDKRAAKLTAKEKTLKKF